MLSNGELLYAYFYASNSILIFFRGAQFRKEFSCIGELRSLIPQGTPLIALTATATVASRNLIILNLGMTNPVVISVSPDIKYHATV